MDVTEETWLTTGEAARIAQRDPRTVRTWADRGILRSRVSPGQHRQIALSSLIAAQQPPGRRTRSRTPNVPPEEAVPQWAATAAEWYGWNPGRHPSTANLETLLKDVRDLVAYLTEIEQATHDELRKRDIADEPAQNSWT